MEIMRYLLYRSAVYVSLPVPAGIDCGADLADFFLSYTALMPHFLKVCSDFSKIIFGFFKVLFLNCRKKCMLITLNYEIDPGMYKIIDASW